MDINKKKRSWRSTRGVISLEASIALTIFIYLMLFMYSFFVVFEARNQMAHTLLTTADSLSLDSFANESVKENSVQELIYKIYGNISDSNGTYTNTSKWYDSPSASLEKEEGEGGEAVEDDGIDFHQIVKARFLSYFSGGSEAEANKILKELNIVGGLDALDFSGSYVSDGDIYLSVKYELEYEFQVFGLGSLEMGHECCSRLWK